MLAHAFKIARMDFTWGGIEAHCGVYDFSAYDGLLAIMKRAGVRPYWILDYGNSCYPPAPGASPVSCSTDACIAGFGRFAAAAATHFHGNGIIWETVNEPNGMGGDNATDLTALALAAAPGFAAFHETFVGPTTAGMDFKYIEAAFAAGILNAYTNVSVHPYRAGPPESVMGDWATLRALIRKYTARGLSMLDGEWGYTSAAPPCRYGNKCSEETQGKYVARMWLSNVASGVDVSIAYDWRDDSTNKTDCESNFGSVYNTPTGNATTPFSPKPAYKAALALQTTIGNADAFSGALPPQAPLSPGLSPSDVFILSFSGWHAGDAAAAGSGTTAYAYAVWTNATAALPCTPAPPLSLRVDCGFHGISKSECASRACCWDAVDANGPQCYRAEAPVPPTPVTFALAAGTAPAACFSVIDVFGEGAPPVCAVGGALTLNASDAPQYVLPL